ncbi:hypothetical protein TWF281_008024 [Arthrobotrys megalospora]
MKGKALGSCRLLLLLQVGLLASIGALSSPLVSPNNVSPTTGVLSPTSASAQSSQPPNPKEHYLSTGSIVTTPLTTITPELRTTPTALETSTPNARAVPPFFFYEGGMHIMCGPPQAALRTISGHLLGQIHADVDNLGISQRMWDSMLARLRNRYHFGGGQPAEQERDEAELAARQQECVQNCKCDGEGRIIHNERSLNCLIRPQAVRCAILFAVLGQPRLSGGPAGNSLADFQQGIDRIPDTVRYDRRNFGWIWNGDRRLPGSRGRGLTFSTPDSRRVNVDDFATYTDRTSEPPFYLYGPNDNPGNGDWEEELTRPLFFPWTEGGLYSPGGSFYQKRGAPPQHEAINGEVKAQEGEGETVDLSV